MLFLVKLIFSILIDEPKKVEKKEEKKAESEDEDMGFGKLHLNAKFNLIKLLKMFFSFKVFSIKQIKKF
jgi:hypothetical protein